MKNNIAYIGVYQEEDDKAKVCVQRQDGSLKWYHDITTETKARLMDLANSKPISITIRRAWMSILIYA